MEANNKNLDRQLYLFDEVNQKTVKELIEKIKTINAYDSAQENTLKKYVREPIVININTGGGNTYSGFALIDAIESSETPVYTYATGHCMSMGIPIFLMGEKRSASKRIRFMTHSSSYERIGGQYNDIMQNALELKEIDELAIDIIVEKTKLKRKQIKKTFETQVDNYFGYEQAKKFGFFTD